MRPGTVKPQHRPTVVAVAVPWEKPRVGVRIIRALRRLLPGVALRYPPELGRAVQAALLREPYPVSSSPESWVQGSDFLLVPGMEPSLLRLVSCALARGIPVIAAESAAARTALGAGGMLVEPDRSGDGFAEAIARLQHDPSEREAVGRRGRAQGRRLQLRANAPDVPARCAAGPWERPFQTWTHLPEGVCLSVFRSGQLFATFRQVDETPVWEMVGYFGAAGYVLHREPVSAIDPAWPAIGLAQVGLAYVSPCAGVEGAVRVLPPKSCLVLHDGDLSDLIHLIPGLAGLRLRGYSVCLACDGRYLELLQRHPGIDTAVDLGEEPWPAAEEQVDLRGSRPGAAPEGTSNDGTDPAPSAQACVPEDQERKETLHVLCPAGVGDFLWIWMKFWSVARSRPVRFWFPGEGQRRAGECAALVGAGYGYLPGLTSDWVWGREGQPPLPPGSGWVSVQANQHLEAGQPLSSWYPELPLAPPEPVLPAPAAAAGPHAYAFIGSRDYMEGNLSAETWVRILARVEEVMPVTVVGAGSDVEFAQEVLREHGKGTIAALFDRPLVEVLSVARSSHLALGVAGGPTIAALCLGIPSLLAYPRWLHRMPGTWEPAGSRWDWCFVSELERKVDWMLR
jgi:hypothetical protein